MTDDGRRRSAIERAYTDLRDDVYRVAYAILRDREAAADATQATFVRAFERWEQYDESRPLRGWLHGIVAHESLDRLRRDRFRRLAAPAVGWLAVGKDAGADPALISGRRAVVTEAMERLGPRERAALILRHYYGYEYAEIAAHLGTSSGNVGSLLSRAHASLRAWIAAAEARPDSVDPHHREQPDIEVI